MKEIWITQYEAARERTGLPYGHARLGEIATRETREHFATMADNMRDAAKHEPAEATDAVS